MQSDNKILSGILLLSNRPTSPMSTLLFFLEGYKVKKEKHNTINIKNFDMGEFPSELCTFKKSIILFELFRANIIK